MSKSNINTRQKILDKALEMFNERGIEYVGMREIAAILDMRVSNITYYFPTKDDLVHQIAGELTRKNAGVITRDEKLSMKGFLVMMERVFHNQVQFRCLMLSFVHLMQQNSLIAADYSKTQRVRTITVRSNIDTLCDSGYLAVKEEKTREFLSSSVSLISRFWISEAAISFRKWSEGDQIKHYLGILCQLMKPYATQKGRKEISEFEESL